MTDPMDIKIIETLDFCLQKMAEHLQSKFDPESKESMRVLYHFRATASLRERVIKISQKERDLPHPVSNQSIIDNNKKSLDENTIQRFPQKSKLESSTPSGLLCPQPEKKKLGTKAA